MSGQAGAILASTYYFISYFSGIRISPAIPPDWDWEKNGDYTAVFFEEENRYFKEKLEAAKTKMDELFHKLIQQNNLPILKFDPNAQHHQSPLFDVNGFESVELRLTVSATLNEENLKEIEQVIRPFFE